MPGLSSGSTLARTEADSSHVLRLLGTRCIVSRDSLSSCLGSWNMHPGTEHEKVVGKKCDGMAAAVSAVETGRHFPSPQYQGFTFYCTVVAVNSGRVNAYLINLISFVDK